MRTLFLDCFSGISGDMSVAALLDLGLDPAALEAELAKLGLTSEYRLRIHKSARQNIAGTKFDVLQQLHRSLLTTHHPHAHGRNHAQIKTLLAAADLAPAAKERALATFQRVAVAEGKIHGMPPDDVHFHEVGAIDSIIDIVAFCFGVHLLGIERVLVSNLFEGTGFITCAHGRFPLPAPATLEILAGIPLAQIDEPLEFITPTGAAIVAEFGESFGPMPVLRVDRIGYGLGTRDTSPRPNVLRAILAETDVSPETDAVTQIETNLDDCPAELIGACTERLLAAGALDVFTVPAQMKKNRPGVLLSVLCDPADADRLATMILRETTAFGVRLHDTRRLKLRREIDSVDTPHGPVDVKRGYLGDELVQSSPEFESCKALAQKTGISIKEIYRAATSSPAR